MEEMRGARRRAGALVLLAALAAAVIVVTGCGSSSSPSGATASVGGGAGHASKGAGDEFVIMLNGDLANPNFGGMKQGADAAAKALGISYQYSAPANETNFVPDYTTLMRQAIGRHPSAIVIGNFVPSAFDPLIKQATKAGIPVVVVNSGLETWKSDGALTYVGNSFALNGTANGAEAVKSGVHHLVCVNAAPVNPGLTQFCQAAGGVVRKAGGTADMLNIPTADNANPSAVTQDIHGYLASHPQVDGVQMIGSSVANAIAAVKAAGRTGKIMVGAEDLTTAGLKAIKSGEVAWICDEEFYLQGFDSLQVAAQYVRYKVYPSAPIMTGPLIVDKSNVDDVLAVQTRYPGLRGAS